jgi:hypothetical protein
MVKWSICRIAYIVLRIAYAQRDTQYARRITNDQLILCRIFHLARRFLLPILRLRLGFAIYFSTDRQKTLS